MKHLTQVSLSICSPFSKEVYFEGIFSGINNYQFLKACHFSCQNRPMSLQMSGKRRVTLDLTDSGLLELCS